MKLNKIGVLSLGYVTAILGLVMGLVNVLLTFLLVKNPIIGVNVLGEQQIAILSASNWWILVGPLIAIIGGFIGGILIAIVYNKLVVKITGGLEINLDHK